MQHASTQLNGFGLGMGIGFKPRDHFAWNTALDQLFDVGQEAFFVNADQ